MTPATVHERTTTAADDAERRYVHDVVYATRGLGVKPNRGLSAAEAATRLEHDGPNALPSEKTTPQQFGVALLCATVLLLVWEAAEAIARNRFEGPAEGTLVAGNGVAG